jgi:hypothetical protein
MNLSGFRICLLILSSSTGLGTRSSIATVALDCKDAETVSSPSCRSSSPIRSTSSSMKSSWSAGTFCNSSIASVVASSMDTSSSSRCTGGAESRSSSMSPSSKSSSVSEWRSIASVAVFSKLNGGCAVVVMVARLESRYLGLVVASLFAIGPKWSVAGKGA